MQSLRILHAVQLVGRRRRGLSFPVKIPTAETRRRRQPIAPAPTTTLDRVQPSGRRVGHLAPEDRKFCAVLTAGENATLSPSLK